MQSWKTCNPTEGRKGAQNKERRRPTRQGQNDKEQAVSIIVVNTRDPS